MSEAGLRWVHLVSSVYFDSSVYGFIQACGEEEAVRELIRRRRHRLLASVEGNLGEAFRIREPTEREGRLRAITRIAHGVVTPRVSLRQDLEVLDEVRRIHPSWLRRLPGINMIDRQRVDDAALWTRLRRDPASVVPNAAVESVVARVIGETRGAQKELRQLDHGGALSTASSAGSTVAAALRTPDSEHYWRTLTSVELSNLLREPRARSGLIPRCLSAAVISHDDWQRFWLSEVDRARVRHVWFMALMEREQHSSRITFGNLVDRLHATHLLEFDLMITCDQALARAATAVAQRVGARGACAHVPRDSRSACAGLQTIL